ncbi:hypothetical protein [Streptomyces iranensis]|uniref:Uncharacterized protein n=1 Tax=Streptomyces iranensis TaxID=576784 RepID=A0A060ZYZ6_9ACTN|nr:hypothetical protein [Streptomyces iranensis]MBP2066081.1 hypothetical protein [Streptomyces iranensis]CDR13432.1 predicted protein [Streptomyces iranensis]
MPIKKLPAAAGAVVALGAVGDQHGVQQDPVAVTPHDETPRNTPWT